MAKSIYTHLVYLNNNIDPKIWSLYAPFCQEWPAKNSDIKHYAMLCSNIDLSSVSYLQVTAHFSISKKIKLKVPHHLVLLIRTLSDEDTTVTGIAPKVSQ